MDADSEVPAHQRIRLFLSISIVSALVRRRTRLAIAVGLAVTISVLTTEILKSLVLSRPSLDEVAGIAQNSFPSGHATIGISLSLGMIMVAPHRWRWAAMIAAQFGEIEDRLTPRWAFLIGLLVVAAAGIALVLSFTADGLDTVEFAADYIVVCVMILALGSFIVIGYDQMLRGVSLDSPRHSKP
jgi:hypothetical protein